MNRSLATFVSLAALLAGCMGGDAQPAATADVKQTTDAPDVDVGGLRGIVTDEEQRPVPGATVRIETADGANNRTIDTAEDGTFLFSDVPVGRYAIQAEALFFTREVQHVDVLSGEIASVTFVLADVVQNTLFVEVFPLTGFINCSIHSLGPYGPFNPCENAAEDSATFPIPVRTDAVNKGIVLELVWSPTTPATGTDLELSLCDEKDDLQDPINCRPTTGDGFRRDVRGKSPLILRAVDLPWAEYPSMQVNVGDGGQVSARVPVTFQQSFELWMSLCYSDYCSETYSARPPE